MREEMEGQEVRCKFCFSLFGVGDLYIGRKWNRETFVFVLYSF